MVTGLTVTELPKNVGVKCDEGHKLHGVSFTRGFIVVTYVHLKSFKQLTFQHVLLW